MRATFALVIIGLLAFSGCTYQPSDSPTEEVVEAESILGCTDSEAENYDSNATEDDDSCEYDEPEPEPEPILGCTDSCLLYTSPSPRDRQKSRMPSSA